VIGHGKLLGNDMVGPAINKEGAEREVAAVQGLGWLNEELTTKGIIHDVDSELRVTFRGRAQLDAMPDPSRFQGRAAAGSVMRREQPGIGATERGR
jgi:hypothetical protein